MSLTSVEVFDEPAEFLPLLVLANGLRVDLAFFHKPSTEFLGERDATESTTWAGSVIRVWAHTGCLFT